jgi:hypothetical protein
MRPLNAASVYARAALLHGQRSRSLAARSARKFEPPHAPADLSAAAAAVARRAGMLARRLFGGSSALTYGALVEL